MEKQEIKALLEALLFTSHEPLTPENFRSVMPDVEKEELREVLQEIRSEYEERQSGIVLREVAGGYQFFTDPRWHSEIQELFSKPLIIRLSRSALETLAIVSYKQPITLPEIGEIRSCNAAGAIKTLLECNFIKVLGRKRVVGRPFLYGTTREFLIHFGLKDLSELPHLQEFEELIGEKLSPEIFHTSSGPEVPMDTETFEESANEDIPSPNNN
jgi:segregation and condensation protein B